MMCKQDTASKSADAQAWYVLYHYDSELRAVGPFDQLYHARLWLAGYTKRPQDVEFNAIGICCNIDGFDNVLFEVPDVGG